MKPARILLLLLPVVAGVRAANIDEFKRDCEFLRQSPGVNPLIICLSDFFTLTPVHPIVRSIVPGGGTGPGLNYKLDSPKGEWHRIFNVTGAISFRNFWIGQGTLSLTHPKFGGRWNTARDSFATHFYARARGLPQMTFYGLGPNSDRADLVNFRQDDQYFGADVINPLSSWIGVGGVVEGIHTSIEGIHEGTIRSIDDYYTEATAPGLATQPAFVHSGIFAHPHHKDPLELDYQIGYHFYTDTGSGHYSFRRFKADLRHNIYPERPGGQPKRDSVLSIRALVSIANTSNGNVVPFYLQETLGGSDINGDPMLRGFADYRFRAPNLLYVSTQYDKRVWSYLGLMGFYDAGQVAMHGSDLSFTKMRQSFGFGVTFWAEARIVFRAYMGLGSGEGRHNFFGIPANLP